MTEFHETRREKVALFLDHYETISTVQSAFEDRWQEFTANWGERLAERLGATTIDDPDVPDEYLAVLLPVGEAERRWVFRHGHDDWAWLFPTDWWTDPVTGDHLYDTTGRNARVGFLHRLDRNRDDALADHELHVYLRNAPSSTDAFYDGFAARFADTDDVDAALPPSTRKPGRKSNVLEATYDIDTSAHEDFFTAYVDALARALDDHACSNPALIDAIDRVYEATVTEDCRS